MNKDKDWLLIMAVKFDWFLWQYTGDTGVVGRDVSVNDVSRARATA